MSTAPALRLVPVDTRPPLVIGIEDAVQSIATSLSGRCSVKLVAEIRGLSIDDLFLACHELGAIPGRTRDSVTEPWRWWARAEVDGHDVLLVSEPEP